MNYSSNYSDTLWRNALGAFVVSPIAPPSLQTHAAAKPAAERMSAVGIKRHAAAPAVASVNWGYI